MVVTGINARFTAKKNPRWGRKATEESLFCEIVESAIQCENIDAGFAQQA